MCNEDFFDIFWELLNNKLDDLDVSELRFFWCRKMLKWFEIGNVFLEFVRFEKELYR